MRIVFSYDSDDGVQIQEASRLTGYPLPAADKLAKKIAEVIRDGLHDQDITRDFVATIDLNWH